MVWPVQKHHLNQWELREQIYRKTTITIHENAFKNVFFKMSSILSLLQCVRFTQYRLRPCDPVSNDVTIHNYDPLLPRGIGMPHNQMIDFCIIFIKWRWVTMCLSWSIYGNSHGVLHIPVAVDNWDKRFWTSALMAPEIGLWTWPDGTPLTTSHLPQSLILQYLYIDPSNPSHYINNNGTAPLHLLCEASKYR